MGKVEEKMRWSSWRCCWVQEEMKAEGWREFRAKEVVFDRGEWWEVGGSEGRCEDLCGLEECFLDRLERGGSVDRRFEIVEEELGPKGVPRTEG